MLLDGHMLGKLVVPMRWDVRHSISVYGFSSTIKSSKLFFKTHPACVESASGDSRGVF